MTERMRLDKFLLEQGFMASRSEAQAAIAAGKVRVNDQVVTKASSKIGVDDQVIAEKAHPYVSRAALKLKGALEVFDLNVSGVVALDIGCSTGGFTEVLLEAGAAHIYAVDVGRDQFHARLREHDKIRLLEQTDARILTRQHIDADLDLIVSDASFIGLEKVLLPALDFVKSGGQAILLFKPQFQVGPKHVGKGGIVTDMDAVETAKAAFEVWLDAQGWHIHAYAPSPITGSDGNQEYLIHAMKN